ncbi:Uncharacterised protein [Streptococcus suis]|uniref:Uncharacterized protein n=1 Tax=Streptococcus suis TaxID=1307 RepID=A0A0Z8J8C5_STRSU|nr:Uncharacterised protein [Streptococcus suis]CYU59327.1 Uncharacterised protein [Streptococcus suis]CYU66734.1 Uncharacterised protein [Streptococcus suis]CYU75441.1 Uncharacterised protein [Streptococcus suis]CYV49017.1 Uncharacterised protein [Streptococcus suis]
MTQEEIDKMIEDWIENGFPSELKQLIPDEEGEYGNRNL